MEGINCFTRIRHWFKTRFHLPHHVISSTYPSDSDIAQTSTDSELFNVDQLECHGKSLALRHQLTSQKTADKLLKRLAASEVTLRQACQILGNRSQSLDNMPAAEWLLDNFYLLEEQIRTTRRHLPKDYGQSLPQLESRDFVRGTPRVYDIASQIIQHGDGRWDLESLERCLTAYQSVTPLTLGELWATPIMLRLALLENLSTVSSRVATDWQSRHLASHWADKMIAMALADPKRLILVVADMARTQPNLRGAFVAELTRRLQGAGLALPLVWIEQQLSEEGITLDQIAQEESAQQAAYQVSVRNGIAGLRRLGQVDWRQFVQRMSVIEQILNTDPMDVYRQMDFSTRDRYRQIVENLARVCGHSEAEVARQAVELARLPHSAEWGERHVGFYLIDSGLHALKKKLGIRLSWWKKCRGLIRNHALAVYLGSIILLTGTLITWMLSRAEAIGMAWGYQLCLGVALGIGVSQTVIGLVNWAAMLLIKPKPLPKMDFSQGIPEEYRTLVVVPAMLNNAQQIASLVEALEVRFLGNRDPHIYFALLTDFNDAPQEKMPADKALLQIIENAILDLNARYSQEQEDHFFLFHRARRWNPEEGVWMGWERKRGKLTELNAFLWRNDRQNFSVMVGDTSKLSSVKYVITLDSDTQLPREAAKQLIGAMAHPLNAPYYDKKRKLVTKGYGILQPRIAETLPHSDASRYLRLSTSEAGVDPYTRTVSDVYQDVFQQGSYTGKGIYDVGMFERVLAGRFPENRILSHDLLEGCYLRSGWISDVPLYETSPNSYWLDVKRRKRWIRGDWQIMGWLLPRVLNEAKKLERNPLSWLSRWKILDNLRRSLVAPSLVLLLILSWVILPQTSFWLIMILGILIMPEILAATVEWMRKPSDRKRKQHTRLILKTAWRRLQSLIFYLACLPYEAYYSLGAIGCALWRLGFSHRHLLEWTPFDQLKEPVDDHPIEWLRSLWIAPAIAVGLIIFLITTSRWISLAFALPLLVLWLMAPLLARWLSQPMPPSPFVLDTTQTRFLRQLARKTWEYFAAFVTAEDHWLPPDNYQEAPVEILNHRTSPTNIGLALLANLTAYDFGYLTMGQLLQRSADTLQTMTHLERYRGHFYNWYHTQTLEPLKPYYISTVDSGNLAGHLLTLRQGLLQLLDTPLFRSVIWESLEDTFEIFKSLVMGAIPPEAEAFAELWSKNTGLVDWKNLMEHVTKLSMAAKAIESHFSVNPSNEAYAWAQKLTRQCEALQNEYQPLLSLSGVLPLTASLRDLKKITLPSTQTLHADLKIYAESRMRQIDMLSDMAFEFAQMDFSFLYNKISRLLSIGFHVEEQTRDASDYDLLSSEARLAVFLAISQGQIPQESWFALGRLQMLSESGPVLMSWSGSMFEYLMPLLVMPSYPNTLLDQACRAAVKHQIAYGKRRNVPWGISESGYHAVDVNYNYLYRAFGAPGLGLQRGLSEELVIAPYATVMALMIAPKAALRNLQRLAEKYPVGTFGFYEAIDFTPTRLPGQAQSALVRSFMAHHQGMSLLAYSFLLHGQPMQRRFTADPLFQASLLLLQERIPKPVAAYFQPLAFTHSVSEKQKSSTSGRGFHTPNTRLPQVQLLSNGRYHVMLTQAGGGYSRWQDISLTRWREDSTRDHWGLFGYLRDLDTGLFWASTYQPVPGKTENFRAFFSEAHAEYYRSDHKITLHTEIVVSPEDDLELRRLRIHNRSKIKRALDWTSYTEIVLNTQTEDESQPAFSGLFVETELLPEQRAIMVRRRSRDERVFPWMFQILNSHEEKDCSLSFETSRAHFIGRGNTLAAPQAMTLPGELGQTDGAVLDPIASIRCGFILEAEESITLDLLMGVAQTREECLNLIAKYQDRHMANRIFGAAWTHNQVLLKQFNISVTQAELYSRLASNILYAHRSRRAESGMIASNRRNQTALWGYGISGDLPMVLLQIADNRHIDLVKQLIQAQSWWRFKGLHVDLLILNEERSSYRQTLQEQIMSLIAMSGVGEHQGGIFLRMAEQISAEDRILFMAVARVVLSDKLGSLAEQMNQRRIYPPPIPKLKPAEPLYLSEEEGELPALEKPLQYDNGIGGFTSEGDEYVISLAQGKTTPAPWINLLVNPDFGTLISESGQGYTWLENAHEFRLTPCHHDAVQDTSGEACYLRDDLTGQYWSVTALPCPGKGEYRVRHGFGYSLFEHVEAGIYSEYCVYVALDAPVKLMTLKIHNRSRRTRRLSAYGYVEWVLGDLRAKNASHTVTSKTLSGGVWAENHYHPELNTRTAFFDLVTTSMGIRSKTLTADRTEFIGRNGSLRQPAALKRTHLSGRTGAGFDPCAAIQLTFELAAGESREILYKLGAGQDKSVAENWLMCHQTLSSARTALLQVSQYWRSLLKNIQVNTPHQPLNLLANGWLLYQVLSSRIWGRAGYYQSSGALGFRDQLQDVLALLPVLPDLTRQHLLTCAGRQFMEGDVQHWWHPPSGRGVRTRCSDDYLWLPFALCRYVEVTGDLGILDESVGFLMGRALHDDEESWYDLPAVSTESASLYQHAVRAVLHGLRFGQHGLPLMGSGDWNDGMNQVGIKGKGESVWLGFFLYTVLQRFSALAEQYGDLPFAQHCRQVSETLRNALQRHGWDGQWYRRAYFDDGTPLGSSENTECRIDSIAQSWAVFSQAVDLEYAKQAMSALSQQLVKMDLGMIQVLTPPFDRALPNPGYIKGYVPGVRENGGQYTHAAVWAIMAFIQLKETQFAWELFDHINPIRHGETSTAIATYQIEPYVVAADVYSALGHEGRGGWSWYTGAAGWMYRLILESFLGLQLEAGNQLHLKPNVPEEWQEFSVDYGYQRSHYQLNFVRQLKNEMLEAGDEIRHSGETLTLLDDGEKHRIWVMME